MITIKQEKEIKEIQMGKEVTLSVLEYVILFIGVLKSSPKGLSQLRNDFIKLQETIISKHMYSLCRANSWSSTPSLQSFWLCPVCGHHSFTASLFYDGGCSTHHIQKHTDTASRKCSQVSLDKIPIQFHNKIQF